MQNYRLSWPVFSEAPAFTLRRYAGKISYPASFAEQAWRSAKMLLFLELCSHNRARKSCPRIVGYNIIEGHFKISHQQKAERIFSFLSKRRRIHEGSWRGNCWYRLGCGRAYPCVSSESSDGNPGHRKP